MKVQPIVALITGLSVLMATPIRSVAEPEDAPSGAAANQQAPETSKIAWGPVVDNLQAGLRLAPPRTTFAPGEPIWQEVYLRNRSQSDVVVQTVGGYENQGAPVIRNTKGATVKVLQYFGMGAMYVATTRVRPGEIGLVGQFAVTFQVPGHGRDLPHEVAPGLSSSAEEMPLALAGPGSYVLRQNLAPMAADEKTRMKTVPTGSLPIQIAGEPAGAMPLSPRNDFDDLSKAPVAWGPQSGLRAGLLYVGPKSHFFVGERIRLAVVLHNVSNKSISFWHQTSFAFLEPPVVLDAAGKKLTVALAPEPEWKSLGELRLTGVTFDMSFAPSADGPSRLARSDIEPGRSTIGYYLTAFVAPPTWGNGRATPGHYHVIQPVRIGLGDGAKLDTSLETGSLNLEIEDPHVPAL